MLSQDGLIACDYTALDILPLYMLSWVPVKQDQPLYEEYWANLDQ